MGETLFEGIDLVYTERNCCHTPSNQTTVLLSFKESSPMQQLFLLAVTLTATIAQANIGPQGFRAFLNPYFVETGTFGGGGILKALEAGFPSIRSIEADPTLWHNTKKTFAAVPNITFFLGNSAIRLWDMIKDIQAPITFWLDAHVFPAKTDGTKNCPLIEELDQIQRHPIKTHTILIDDLHCAGTAAFDYLTKEDLIKKILEINPAYKITYVPGGDAGEYPENVMVAQVGE